MTKELEPAFARPHSEDADFVHHAQAGMTLRDYFAAKAMQSLIWNPDIDLETKADVAEVAYHYADAMLKERSK
jgi:hypothetical protein